jgi:hypothetical protein
LVILLGLWSNVPLQMDSTLLACLVLRRNPIRCLFKSDNFLNLLWRLAAPWKDVSFRTAHEAGYFCYWRSQTRSPFHIFLDELVRAAIFQYSERPDMWYWDGKARVVSLRVWKTKNHSNNEKRRNPFSHLGTLPAEGSQDATFTSQQVEDLQSWAKVEENVWSILMTNQNLSQSCSGPATIQYISILLKDIQDTLW